jgi:leader peptidase (prepilin peptidase)/N-methyltransferase
MEAILFGLFGLIVGSFLNVVILRFGEKSIGGRSECPSCHRQLHWYDMVPVLSWVFLRGRCRSCHMRISIQYPLVEAITGGLFALVGGVALPMVSTVFALVIVALLVCISVYDLYHTIIPDQWVWPFSFLALAFMVSIAPPTTLPAVALTLAAGVYAALPLFALWFVSRGRWMGFGDVKLALGIGWLLGPTFGVVAVFFAFVIGAVISLGILLPLPYYRRAFARFTPTAASKKSAEGFTMKSEVPFGPFLILSCLSIWFALLYSIPIPLFS